MHLLHLRNRARRRFARRASAIAATPAHAAAQFKHNLTDIGRRASLAVKVLVRPTHVEGDLSDYLSHHKRVDAPGDGADEREGLARKRGAKRVRAGRLSSASRRTCESKLAAGDRVDGAAGKRKRLGTVKMLSSLSSENLLDPSLAESQQEAADACLSQDSTRDSLQLYSMTSRDLDSDMTLRSGRKKRQSACRRVKKMLTLRRKTKVTRGGHEDKWAHELKQGIAGLQVTGAGAGASDEQCQLQVRMSSPVANFPAHMSVDCDVSAISRVDLDDDIFDDDESTLSVASEDVTCVGGEEFVSARKFFARMDKMVQPQPQPSATCEPIPVGAEPATGLEGEPVSALITRPCVEGGSDWCDLREVAQAHELEDVARDVIACAGDEDDDNEARFSIGVFFSKAKE